MSQIQMLRMRGVGMKERGVHIETCTHTRQEGQVITQVITHTGHLRKAYIGCAHGFGVAVQDTEVAPIE